ncbi:MAG TPA: magnesium/cobalt transporter CorA [Gammaproteobacteria bacterium]|nr:magnesium/cobalt transporter CorA [Gammaproteobacteria bacterium]
MDYFPKQYAEPGTAPGSLPERESGAAPVTATLIDYGPDHCEEVTLDHPRDCRPYLERDTRTWIHIQGSPDIETLALFGEVFGLHPLALEDVARLGQRPKADHYAGHLFLVLALPELAEDRLSLQQVSLFLGGSALISFQSGGGDPFGPVRRRLHQASGRIRSRPLDYLLYALADTVVDRGFPVLEALGDRIEAIEDRLLSEPSQEMVARLHGLRRELVLLRRMLWPQREVMNGLMRDEEGWLDEDTRLYLRDAYQHAVQILDLIESYREMTASLLDLYLSTLSHRLNEVMRVLTVFATIFLPITFIAGLYGMNFAGGPWNMPELHWRFGYPFALGLMAAVGLGLVAFFRRKGWL